jgi:hypothetical protein
MMKHIEIIERLRNGITEYGAARLLTGLDVSFGSTKLLPHSLKIVGGQWHVRTAYAELVLPQEIIDGIVGTVIREALGERDNAQDILARSEALSRKVFGRTSATGDNDVNQQTALSSLTDQPKPCECATWAGTWPIGDEGHDGINRHHPACTAQLISLTE